MSAWRRRRCRPTDARALIERLRVAPLLRGLRGRPAADVAAAADALVRLSWLAADMGPRLAELDINPLILRAAGQGVIAVDARATLIGGNKCHEGHPVPPRIRRHLARAGHRASAGRRRLAQQRSVVLVVPYPPGGSTDNVARPLMQEWSRVIGQTIVIENRGGAGGTIGAEMVSRAKPDGHTLAAVPDSDLHDQPDHDAAALRCRTTTSSPIARLAASDAFVVINPSVPARTTSRSWSPMARRIPASCASAPPATAPSRS